MTTERSEAAQFAIDTSADISTVSREELEAQYGYQSTILGKLVERAGGVVTIPADAWQGNQQLKRLWFSQSESGDITVELKVHE